MIYLIELIAVGLLGLWAGHAFWVFLRNRQCRKYGGDDDGLRKGVAEDAALALKLATSLRLDTEETLKDFYNMRGAKT